MFKKTTAVFAFLLWALPLAAGGRRRAASPPLSPGEAVRRAILAKSALAADRLYALRHDGADINRRGWEDPLFMTGGVQIGEQWNKLIPGSGDRFIARADRYVGNGEDFIAGAQWTAYAETALELYRILPADSPRRAELLQAIQKPLEFAARAIRVPPQPEVTQCWYWVEGCFGTEFWQDDLYMLHGWLAKYGSSKDGFPGNQEASDVAIEATEAYIKDHRPLNPADPRGRWVPSDPVAHGYFLWADDVSLVYHDPTAIGTDNFWGRGQGWSIYGLGHMAVYRDKPYMGTLYPSIMTDAELDNFLDRLAGSLILPAHRTSDGGWGTSISRPSSCDWAETSGTALITLGLAESVRAGKLNRVKYLPAILANAGLINDRITSEGDVLMIQPSGGGPSCDPQSSAHPVWNLDYGVGAVLMMNAEILKLSNEDLAKIKMKGVNN